MPALLILAHAPLASALKQAALHTYAEYAQHLQALDIPAHADLPTIQAMAREALARAQSCANSSEVLIMTDVCGATPCNIATVLAQEPGVKVVTGVNVPMLWRVLNYAGDPLDQLVTKALAGAAQGVMQIAQTAPQQQQPQVTAHAEVDHHHQQ